MLSVINQFPRLLMEGLLPDKTLSTVPAFHHPQDSDNQTDKHIFHSNYNRFSWLFPPPSLKTGIHISYQKEKRRYQKEK